MNSEKLQIRPYARLLTMLGDQLIRNERIALIELIKNAYDADADWVDVCFENFNTDMTVTNTSSIVVVDKWLWYDSSRYPRSLDESGHSKKI